MFTLPLQHNSFLEGGFRILMMSATLKRHGIKCVDLDQNGGCVPTLKGFPNGLPSCMAMASGCLAL